MFIFVVDCSCMKDCLTTKDAAKRLNVDPSRIRQMVLGGIIKAEKFGRDLVIAEDEIKRIEQLERRPGRPMKVKSEQA
jgi:excisionase family DNA binding protein